MIQVVASCIFFSEFQPILGTQELFVPFGILTCNIDSEFFGMFCSNINHLLLCSSFLTLDVKMQKSGFLKYQGITLNIRKYFYGVDEKYQKMINSLA